jgi:hypothetical protein
MTHDEPHPTAPTPGIDSAEQGQEKQNGRKASHLLQDALSTYLVRAWYEYHGSPYGDNERGLLRWTQEQLDRMNQE